MKENKSWIGILSLIVALLVLLFGNNWIFRACQSEDSEDVTRSRSEEGALKESVLAEVDPLKEKDRPVVKPDTLQVPAYDHEAELIQSSLKEISLDSLSSLFFSGKKELVKEMLSGAIINSDDLDSKRLEDLKKDIAVADDLGVDVVFHNTAGDLIITESNENFGFADLKGNVLFKPIFDEIEPLAFHPFTLVRKGDKWGILKGNGEFLLELEYDDVGFSLDDVLHFPVKKGEKINLHDRVQGGIIFRDLDHYERIWARHILISKKGFYGLIDLEAKELLPIEFDTIFIPLIDDPYVAVIKKGKKSFYDLEMNKIDNPLYD